MSVYGEEEKTRWIVEYPENSQYTRYTELKEPTDKAAAIESARRLHVLCQKQHLRLYERHGYQDTLIYDSATDKKPLPNMGEWWEKRTFDIHGQCVLPKL